VTRVRILITIPPLNKCNCGPSPYGKTAVPAWFRWPRGYIYLREGLLRRRKKRADIGTCANAEHPILCYLPFSLPAIIKSLVLSTSRIVFWSNFQLKFRVDAAILVEFLVLAHMPIPTTFCSHVEEGRDCNTPRIILAEYGFYNSAPSKDDDNTILWLINSKPP
jgi:hypothetical protein